MFSLFRLGSFIQRAAEVFVDYYNTLEAGLLTRSLHKDTAMHMAHRRSNCSIRMIPRSLLLGDTVPSPLAGEGQGTGSTAVSLFPLPSRERAG